MSRIIEGKIISTNLAEFSKKRIVYGYVGIELQDKTHISVKIDAYTKYETLSLGDDVIMEIDNLADSDILVARKIMLKSNSDMSSEGVSATA
ncbi:MAG: hypothetical protein PVJ05_05720 [Candidatus Thorarchaeota archaeon]|jgi:hypothetical protein